MSCDVHAEHRGRPSSHFSRFFRQVLHPPKPLVCREGFRFPRRGPDSPSRWAIVSTEQSLRSPSAHGETILMATSSSDVDMLTVNGIERSGVTFLICWSFQQCSSPASSDVAYQAWRLLQHLPAWTDAHTFSFAVRQWYAGR